MRTLLTTLLLLATSALLAQLTFGPAQLIDAPSGVVTVYAADFDGDNIVDLLSTSTGDGITWWKNDGTGSFTEGQYLQQLGDVPLSLAAAIADYDGDGDLDVLAIINTTVSTSPTDIQYFINDGSGGFTNGFIIGTVGASAQEIVPVDLDGDGDLDAVWAEAADDEIGWVENVGGSFNTPVVLITSANGAQTITCDDFDQDGDIDIMAAGEYDDEWAWHKNNGSEVFGSQILIGTGNNVSSVFHTDLDGDNEPDGLAVYGIDGDVLWTKNLGGGAGFDTPEYLLEGVGFPDNFPITIEAYDLDQDGDMDPVACSILDNTISWYQNTGAGTFAAQEVLITGASNVRQTAAGDFDGDGDLDLAAANFGASELVWYENTSAIADPEGCTDETACNYDPTATSDNGTCDYSCYGCTDPAACNYDASAPSDDGTCIYPFGCDTCSGETDGTGAVVDNPEVGSPCDDGNPGTVGDIIQPDCSCMGTFDLPGCIDPLACNYDAGAFWDDGSCIYPTGCDTCSGETDGTGTVVDNPEVGTPCDDGLVSTIIDTIQADCTCVGIPAEPGCTDPAACNYSDFANVDDGSCDYSCFGCTAPEACNYSAEATIDDGSCDFCSCVTMDVPGCTNPGAINYQPDAVVDDGSCLFPADICGAGTLWNPETGQCETVEAPVCPGDFDGDGTVSTEDLLDFLGFFGTSCG